MCGVTKVKVYHGTILSHALNIADKGINLRKSKNYLDFGKGFYTTPDYEMAKNMAKRVAAYEKTKYSPDNLYPTVVTFEYEEDSQMNIKIFPREDMSWAKFILSNRLPIEIANKLNLPKNKSSEQYDIIIGGTADGDIAYIASGLRYGTILPEDYYIDLKDFLKYDGKSYGQQIVFCTEKALSCIEYIKCDKV